MIIYFSQKFSMPDDRRKALLNDIATEELGHMEMVATMANQLMKNATIDEIKAAGLESIYANHGKGIYPVNVSGVPFTVSYFDSQNDVLANISEDIILDGQEQSVSANFKLYLVVKLPNPHYTSKIMTKTIIINFSNGMALGRFLARFRRPY